MLVIVVLISVAFMVLFERKILGYIQLRKGPNKVSYAGILQSFGDAIKLFVKEQTIPLYSNIILYYYAPVLSLVLIILVWCSYPAINKYVDLIFGGLFFFCCTSMGVYALIGSGWSSNSNYALLGAIRGVAQTVSYEVSIALIFISLIFLTMDYKIHKLRVIQLDVWFIFIFMPIFYMWLVSILAETNRTPFDFAEGESELVSGFNIEYGRGGFAFLFLAEYGRIIFIRYLVGVLFFGGLFNLIFINIISVYFCFWFIWVRGTMPRYRYDKLIGLAWKVFLPASLLLIGGYLFLRVIS
jgi:NADH-ubiquinone oxidoreductase chain 1